MDPTLDLDALLSRGVFAFPMAVRSIYSEDDDPIARNTADTALDSGLLKLAKSHALDARWFDEHPPFFWRAEISNTSLDSYFTHMMPSSLKNYAQEAEQGRAFLLSHNWREVPWGYTLTGRYVGAQKNGQARTEADLYTSEGLSGPGGMGSESIIGRLKGGFLRDVSIGFSGGRWICSIDGADMLTATWEECSHWPGMEYTKAAEPGATRKKDPTAAKVLCTVGIEDAHLNEVSGVYDGATPGAAVLRAVRAVQEGRLTIPQTRFLEQHYRVRLLTDTPSRRQHPGATLEGGSPVENDRTDDDQATTQSDATPATATDAGNATAVAQNVPSVEELSRLRAEARQVDSVVSILQEHGRAADRAAAAGVVLELIKENDGLRADAANGKKYRAAVVKRALEEGVRALGEGFDRAKHEERIFPRLDLEDIEALADTWKATGDATFKAGRSTTEDTDEDGTKPAPRRPRSLSRA